MDKLYTIDMKIKWRVECVGMEAISGMDIRRKHLLGKSSLY